MGKKRESFSFGGRRESGSGICTQRLITFDLNLAISPARDLDDEVDDAVVQWVGVERDVVPEGDGVSVLLEVDSPVLSQD